jgi:hypothetical protein
MAGHAMGCSVICGYWEQYGGDRLSKLILVDQMPVITRNPARPAKELENAGAIFDGKSLFETINALAGPGSVKTTKGFITGIFAKQYSPDEVNWVVQEKYPRAMQRVYCSIMPPTIGETSFLVSTFRHWRSTARPVWFPGSHKYGQGVRSRALVRKSSKKTRAALTSCPWRIPRSLTDWLRSSTAKATPEIRTEPHGEACGQRAPSRARHTAASCGARRPDAESVTALF